MPEAFGIEGCGLNDCIRMYSLTPSPKDVLFKEDSSTRIDYPHRFYLFDADGLVLCLKLYLVWEKK